MSAPEIATDRLLLTHLGLRDAAPFFRYRSDPEVSRYQMWAPATVEEATKFIRDQQSVTFDTPGTWFQFAIRLRDADRLIGDLGVRFPTEDTQQVEIGFTIAPGNQRQGYATEAVIGVLNFLLEARGKHRVFASVDPRNERSIALLRRVGMRQEAHFRESLWTGSEWVDDVVFAVLASEWSGSRSPS